MRGAPDYGWSVVSEGQVRRMVEREAARYGRGLADREDLISEGFLAAYEALLGCDARRGSPQAYLGPAVRGAMWRFVVRSRSPVSVSERTVRYPVAERSEDWGAAAEAADAEAAEAVEASVAIEDALGRLSAVEAAVVRHYHGLDDATEMSFTSMAAGEEVGVENRFAASRLYRRAVKRLEPLLR